MTYSVVILIVLLLVVMKTFNYLFKGKVKFCGGVVYSTAALWLIVLLTPKGVPSFISRGDAHQRLTAASASEGRNYRWNLANNQVIHLNC
jgi:hypothetical protein